MIIAFMNLRKCFGVVKAGQVCTRLEDLRELKGQHRSVTRVCSGLKAGAPTEAASA
jgi:hypothetical protein